MGGIGIICVLVLFARPAEGQKILTQDGNVNLVVSQNASAKESSSSDQILTLRSFELQSYLLSFGSKI